MKLYFYTKKSNGTFIKLTAVFIFILITSLYPQSKQGIAEKVKNLHFTTSETCIDSIKSLLSKFHLYNNTFIREQTESLIKVTSTFNDKRPYVYSLLRYGECLTRTCLDSVNKGYNIALNKEFTPLIGIALESKSIIFQVKRQYDSLAVTLIKAKAFYEEQGNKDDLVANKHITANMFINIRLYDRAEKLLLEILEEKGSLYDWDLWRNKVVLNDLSLIEKERGNYKKAVSYLESSLKLIKKKSSSDSIAAAYIYNLLAQNYFGLKDYKNTVFYYNKSLPVMKRCKRTDNLIELYNLLSEYYRDKEEYDSSFYYCNLSGSLLKNSGTPEDKLKNFNNYYNFYFNRRDYQKALDYKTLYAALSDSLNSTYNNVKIIQSLAEKDIDLISAKLSYSKNKNTLLLALLLLLVGAFVVGLIYHEKLRKLYSKLIDKSVEIATLHNKEYYENISKKTLEPKDLETVSDDNIENELVVKLKALMKSEKSYCNCNLQINEVAELLGTNRTYLSKAVNNKLDKNFSLYISELRVEEAVNEIKNGNYKNMSIEGIAKSVGFNNIVSFRKAFKNYTGVLPSYFIKEVEK